MLRPLLVHEKEIRQLAAERGEIEHEIGRNPDESEEAIQQLNLQKVEMVKELKQLKTPKEELCQTSTAAESENRHLRKEKADLLNEVIANQIWLMQISINSQDLAAMKSRKDELRQTSAAAESENRELMKENADLLNDVIPNQIWPMHIFLRSQDLAAMKREVDTIRERLKASAAREEELGPRIEAATNFDDALIGTQTTLASVENRLNGLNKNAKDLSDKTIRISAAISAITVPPPVDILRELFSEQRAKSLRRDVAAA